MQSFELKDGLHFYRKARSQRSKVVMASLVGLQGSSYRRPGVRMFIAQDGSMSGALSGGCVEKEIIASAQSVFANGVSKIISYDGRYRLGCEGFLYILIEIFDLSEDQIVQIETRIKQRTSIQMTSYYQEGETLLGNFYSRISFVDIDHSFPVAPLKKTANEQLRSFEQEIPPNHQLIIIGTEHDAQKLCANAVLLGWDVTIVASPNNPKNTADFPEAKNVLNGQPDTLDLSIIDRFTSVVLMTHNYALDLKYVLILRSAKIPYIGILGSKKRKTALENDILEYAPEVTIGFLDTLHSPAGLNLGATTPQEIALSILAEIMQVTHKHISSPEAATIKTPLS